ncbi:MAG: ribonuclease Z [Archaeoglobaceae archaeon]|nr:ribonuclease Z [Archaeoglobaceae archaeon]MCX8152482.1 ribonuclease Z [Archaeoglobaceae archaeon]MDW8013703.1 ribonuclease Z [Archaeoglobaceae archaeon]
MIFKVTFLGTAGSVPSVERNVSSIFVQFGAYRFLLDCGEGTQRQMMIAKTGLRNLNHIFITHLHTDHFAGLFGLLETMSLNNRTEELKVYCPQAKILKKVFETFGYDGLSYEVKVEEVYDGFEIDFKDFKILAFKTEHIVPSFGYAIVEKDRRKFDREKAEKLGIPPGPLYAKLVAGESIVLNEKIIKPEDILGEIKKGRKLVYTGDTRPCARTIEVARNADILIHDAAFTEDLKDWAIESGHSTAKEAAEVAKIAEVKKLVLIHISARFSKDPSPLLLEAKNVFENVLIAEDFMQLEIR